MKKRAAPLPWRPSAEAAIALAKLLEGGQTRNALLNELVIRAVEGPFQSASTKADVAFRVVSKPTLKVKPRLKTPKSLSKDAKLGGFMAPAQPVTKELREAMAAKREAFSREMMSRQGKR